jgi:glucoamylase
MLGLSDWVATEARYAATRMSGAISATDLVMERTGFGQRVIPRAGSVLASPVAAHYDPDPDYFFHWFRDAAIVIDALRVALAAGYADRSAVLRLYEFVQFNVSLQSLDGREFLRASDFRARVQPAFLQYLRSDAEIAALSGKALLADTRVNADGTLDFIRWSRPQTDGPAMRCLALLRWWRQFPELQEDPTLRTQMCELIAADLDFTLAYVREPCGDVWEEIAGYHYYTQLLHSEALSRGAEWLEDMQQHDRAAAARVAARETLAGLDDFWQERTGFYRSGTSNEPGDHRSGLDISVVLGVLHAARLSGPHSVLDPKAQATLTALEELFEAQYAINRERPPERGPAMGRYAQDRYYSGGAWYLATLAAAEFYFRLACALRSGAQMTCGAENARFRRRLGAAESTADGEELAALAVERGDAIMRTVRVFTPPGGELSEQFDHTTGAQSSAKHLSWSYAAFITAAASRTAACLPIRAADPGASAADTA